MGWRDIPSLSSDTLECRQNKFSALINLQEAIIYLYGNDLLNFSTNLGPNSLLIDGPVKEAKRHTDSS